MAVSNWRGYAGQWWMLLVISQSKRILLLLLINELEKQRFRKEMGPFVSLVSFPFFFFLALHFSFQNKQQGSLGTDYSSLHHWLFQPFSLLTNVQPQMVNDGILWNSLSRLTFRWMERKVTSSYKQMLLLLFTQWLYLITPVFYMSRCIYQWRARSKWACRSRLTARPALIQFRAAASKQLHTNYPLPEFGGT